MNDYIVFKLVSGDQCMATLLEMDEDCITVENPIALKALPVVTENGIVEKTTTSQLCGITDDRVYEFQRSHIVFMKPLNSEVSDFYQKLITSYDSEKTNDSSYTSKSEKDQPFVIIPEEPIIH